MKNTNALNTPAQYKSLNLIRPIGWDEIFEIWKKGEANQQSWKQHWEERGFDSWDEWRTMYVAPLEPNNLKWFLFEIKNPLQDVSNFYAVPSRSWIEKAYQGEKTKRLSDILQIPLISDNAKIKSITDDFPSETMLIGIVHKENIIIYEGMHRTSAIASWDKNKKFDAKVFIALAIWKDEREIPIVGRDYKNK